MAENLSDIIKGAGIKVDANDKFRKKSNAERLAETLQQAIQDDIEAVKAKATTMADQAKARLKKVAAKDAKDAFEKSKNAGRDAAKNKAKLASEKAYLEQASMRALNAEDKVKYDAQVKALADKIELQEEI